MKLTIDTEKDSSKDIKKAVAFLNMLLESDPSLPDKPAGPQYELSAPADMFGMFESPQDESDQQRSDSCHKEPDTGKQPQTNEKIVIYDI